MQGFDLPHIAQLISIWGIPVIIAITFHEAAHGFVAWRLGDDTAYKLGRVTFNPVKHIDPFGTILLPALLLMTSPFLFGYAKPVPVSFGRLHRPRRDMVLVAAAGPGINLLLAVVSALLVYAVVRLPPAAADWGLRVIGASISLNLVLAVFNMLPLPPLDGGRVAVGLLPRALARPLARLEPYGMFILIGLLFILPWLGAQAGVNLNVFQWIIGPVVGFLRALIIQITGLG